MKKVFTFFGVLFISLANAFFDIEKDHDGIKWNGLRVKWGRQPDNDHFVSFPRTVQEATKQGFEKVSDCSEIYPWRGARYVKNADFALVLLFDINGFIAGIQTSVLKNASSTYPAESLMSLFEDDEDRRVLSLYFISPEVICSSGRTAENFEETGTGTAMYIQNGSNAESDLIEIPRKESEMDGYLMEWAKGKLLKTMGMHYWYDLHEDMDCNEIFPYFFLYDQGQLIGFAWTMPVNQGSPQYEYPPFSFLQLTMTTIPQCLRKSDISSLHVWVVDIKGSDDNETGTASIHTVYFLSFISSAISVYIYII